MTECAFTQELFFKKAYPNALASTWVMIESAKKEMQWSHTFILTFLIMHYTHLNYAEIFLVPIFKAVRLIFPWLSGLIVEMLLFVAV